MLSPKKSQITAASGTFGQDERDLWLPLLRGSVIYSASSPPVFVDVESKLLAIVENSMQAKQLNATMTLIDRIGPVDATAKGADNYSTLANREGLLEYAMSILYGADYWPLRNSVPRSYRVRNVAVLR